MSTEHLWNDNGRELSKYSEKNLVPLQINLPQVAQLFA